MGQELNLRDVLEQIEDKAQESSTLTIDDLVSHFQTRGFGPLIMFPALIAGLPTGAIPGVPSLCGLCVALISIQMVWGKKYPWLPQKLADIKVSQEKIKQVIPKALPWAEKVDRILKRRMTGLTHTTAQRLTAVITTLFGLSMIPLELVPLAAAVPAWSLVFLALGFSGQDGLFILLGYGVAVFGGALVLIL
jgi:hypothetical protein